MNMFVVLSALLALTAAAPGVDRVQSRAQELAAIRRLPALDHEEVHDEFGQYAMRYVTAEGIVVSERGRLVPNIKGDGYVLIIEGEVSYIGDDDEVYATKFTAGVDGNHVEENHFPLSSAPVAPEAVISEPSKTKTIEAVTEAFPSDLA